MTKSVAAPLATIPSSVCDRPPPPEPPLVHLISLNPEVDASAMPSDSQSASAAHSAESGATRATVKTSASSAARLERNRCIKSPFRDRAIGRKFYHGMQQNSR